MRTQKIGVRLNGLLTKWQDDRGFGFITPAGGGKDIFVHDKAFQGGFGRPVVNGQVSFELEADARWQKTGNKCPSIVSCPCRLLGSWKIGRSLGKGEHRCSGRICTHLLAGDVDLGNSAASPAGLPGNQRLVRLGLLARHGCRPKQSMESAGGHITHAWTVWWLAWCHRGAENASAQDE